MSTGMIIQYKTITESQNPTLKLRANKNRVKPSLEGHGSAQSEANKREDNGNPVVTGDIEGI